MFTDIADFTTISEELEAEALVRQLSVYFGELVGLIVKDEGTVDKFVGDAIMSYWNAPSIQDDHARRGCSSALRCADASNRLNESWEREGGKCFLHPVWRALW